MGKFDTNGGFSSGRGRGNFEPRGNFRGRRNFHRRGGGNNIQYTQRDYEKRERDGIHASTSCSRSSSMSGYHDSPSGSCKKKFSSEYFDRNQLTEKKINSAYDHHHHSHQEDFSPIHSRSHSRSRSFSSEYNTKSRSRSRSYTPDYHSQSHSRRKSLKSRSRSRERSFTPKYSRIQSRERSFSPGYHSRRKNHCKSFSPIDQYDYSRPSHQRDFKSSHRKYSRSRSRSSKRSFSPENISFNHSKRSFSPDDSRGKSYSRYLQNPDSLNTKQKSNLSSAMHHSILSSEPFKHAGAQNFMNKKMDTKNINEANQVVLPKKNSVIMKIDKPTDLPKKSILRRKNYPPNDASLQKQAKPPNNIEKKETINLYDEIDIFEDDLNWNISIDKNSDNSLSAIRINSSEDKIPGIFDGDKTESPLKVEERSNSSIPGLFSSSKEVNIPGLDSFSVEDEEAFLYGDYSIGDNLCNSKQSRNTSEFSSTTGSQINLGRFWPRKTSLHDSSSTKYSNPDVSSKSKSSRHRIDANVRKSSKKDCQLSYNSLHCGRIDSNVDKKSHKGDFQLSNKIPQSEKTNVKEENDTQDPSQVFQKSFGKVLDILSGVKEEKKDDAKLLITNKFHHSRIDLNVDKMEDFQPPNNSLQLENTSIKEENYSQDSSQVFQKSYGKVLDILSGVKEAKKDDRKRQVSNEEYLKNFKEEIIKHQEEEILEKCAHQQKLKKLKVELKEKLGFYESELKLLQVQQGQLLRILRKEKDGHNNPLIIENSNLQDEIMKNIFNLTQHFNDIDHDKIPKVNLAREDARKNYFKLKKCEYIDCIDHWCLLCHENFRDISTYLDHLQLDSHIEKLDVTDKPWIKNEIKKEEDYSSIKKLPKHPFRGEQFLIPVNGFWCSMCSIFIGGRKHCINHLKSEAHNHCYMDYVLKNDVYEKRWALEKNFGKMMLKNKQLKKDLEQSKNIQKLTHKEKESMKVYKSEKKVFKKTQKGKSPCKVSKKENKQKKNLIEVKAKAQQLVPPNESKRSEVAPNKDISLKLNPSKPKSKSPEVVKKIVKPAPTIGKFPFFKSMKLKSAKERGVVSSFTHRSIAAKSLKKESSSNLEVVYESGEKSVTHNSTLSSSGFESVKASPSGKQVIEKLETTEDSLQNVEFLSSKTVLKNEDKISSSTLSPNKKMKKELVYGPILLPNVKSYCIEEKDSINGPNLPSGHVDDLQVASKPMEISTDKQNQDFKEADVLNQQPCLQPNAEIKVAKESQHAIGHKLLLPIKDVDILQSSTQVSSPQEFQKVEETKHKATSCIDVENSIEPHVESASIQQTFIQESKFSLDAALNKIEADQLEFQSVTTIYDNSKREMNIELMETTELSTAEETGVKLSSENASYTGDADKDSMDLDKQDNEQPAENEPTNDFTMEDMIVLDEIDDGNNTSLNEIVHSPNDISNNGILSVGFLETVHEQLNSLADSVTSSIDEELDSGVENTVKLEEKDQVESLL